ncbi:MAG: hypothetical protein COU08_00345 [Candidatus Harrisonbacteria bacterium CG10_big_fil_rev_8_21_14_0_10_42_17]|uniref:DUF11 domain-containing protein n=1 Tax=Candidatus Harrisonbacteria bacterium CG10_big_fil_rev_8_21_14_0_10_42_17 TaxID=1974584 RepID=A0A2M6WJ79_9BACT|nr:MAG: hypothetical protein COU08_00345 [Candidatus Harrisonbacteria bacterium CG10_big_fil_rev_8_21_14_0_10_42_17]
MPPLKLIFGIVGFFILLAVVVTGYVLLHNEETTPGLDIIIEAPTRVLIGTPFDVTVKVLNNSRNILTDASVSVELPEAMIFVSDAIEKRRESFELGNLGVQSLSQETFTVLALEDENTLKEIKTTVSYTPASLNTRFEKEETALIEIGESGIQVDITIPKKIFNGETFDLDLTYKNISESDIKDLVLSIAYPQSFVYESATLKPDQGDSTWKLGDVNKNKSFDFTVKGSIVGIEQANYEFTIQMEREFFGNRYVIAKKTGRLEVIESPLSLVIEADGGKSGAAEIGRAIKYKLTFTNNTDVTLEDIIVKARSFGELIDIARVGPGAGVFSSVDNSIHWNASNIPLLKALPPRSSASVDFTMQLIDAFPIRRISDKNYTVRVEVEVESTTVPQHIPINRTIGVAENVTKVSGDMQFDQLGLFRDAAAGILNKGPLPPKVRETTEYTIHWQISSSATDLKDIELFGVLGDNVNFTGVVKSNNGILPEFNIRTQMVEWKVPHVPATTGIIGEPVEAIFQVALTPSILQIGNVPVLIKSVTAKATDGFTGVTFERTDGPILTNLSDDPTVDSEQGRVVQ